MTLIPQRLIEHFQSKTVALFIGNDLPSSLTGIAGRSELAEMLSKRNQISGSKSFAEVAELSIGPFNHRNDTISFILDTLNLAAKYPTKLHRLLARLPVETIVTTAYDDLIERSFRDANRIIDTVITPSQIAFANKPSHVTLLYLYGKISSDLNHLVMTKSDHVNMNFRADKASLLNFVQNVFRTRTTLFIGYNLSDPDFDLLYAQVLESMRPFNLGAWAVCSDVNEEYRDIWASKGIRIIDSDVLVFLTELCSRLNLISAQADHENPVQNLNLSSYADHSVIKTKSLESGNKMNIRYDHSTIPSKEMDAANQLDSSVNSIREQSALIMKGGGIKGLAYVGALKELEHYYEFTWFIGTSAGAIAAVLLAAGYTTAELENILSSKNLREFLDAPIYKLPTNLIFYQGLYKANTFTAWVEMLLATKLKSPTQIRLGDLPKRVTIYASRRRRDALVFDSHDPKTKDDPAGFAVRCSMSIPFIFTPQRDAGMSVLDGGMRNNYPVEILLKESPNLNFIGLYLGPEVYEGEADEPSLVSDMLSIWTDATDEESLRQYRDRTIVIDSRPISTIDFSITEDEKGFLLKAGKAAALKFLAKMQPPDSPSQYLVEKANSEAKEAREKVLKYRNRRKRTKTIILVGLCIAIAALFYYIPSCA